MLIASFVELKSDFVAEEVLVSYHVEESCGDVALAAVSAAFHAAVLAAAVTHSSTATIGFAVSAAVTAPCPASPEAAILAAAVTTATLFLAAANTWLALCALVVTADIAAGTALLLVLFVIFREVGLDPRAPHLDLSGLDLRLLI